MFRSSETQVFKVFQIDGFFCNRTQRVKINASFSGYRNINIGLPLSQSQSSQGTTLTLLFFIYLNDLNNAVPAFSTLLFGDDTTLFLSHHSYPHIIGTFDNDLMKMKNYIISNRLSFNADETTANCVGSNPVCMKMFSG